MFKSFTSSLLLVLLFSCNLSKNKELTAKNVANLKKQNDNLEEILNKKKESLEPDYSLSDKIKSFSQFGSNLQNFLNRNPSIADLNKISLPDYNNHNSSNPNFKNRIVNFGMNVFNRFKKEKKQDDHSLNLDEIINTYPEKFSFSSFNVSDEEKKILKKNIEAYSILINKSFEELQKLFSCNLNTEDMPSLVKIRNSLMQKKNEDDLPYFYVNTEGLEQSSENTAEFEKNSFIEKLLNEEEFNKINSIQELSSDLKESLSIIYFFYKNRAPSYTKTIENSFSQFAIFIKNILPNVDNLNPNIDRDRIKIESAIDQTAYFLNNFELNPHFKFNFKSLPMDDKINMIKFNVHLINFLSKNNNNQIAEKIYQLLTDSVFALYKKQVFNKLSLNLRHNDFKNQEKKNIFNSITKESDFHTIVQDIDNLISNIYNKTSHGKDHSSIFNIFNSSFIKPEKKEIPFNIRKKFPSEEDKKNFEENRKKIAQENENIHKNHEDYINNNKYFGMNFYLDSLLVLEQYKNKITIISNSLHKYLKALDKPKYIQFIFKNLKDPYFYTFLNKKSYYLDHLYFQNIDFEKLSPTNKLGYTYQDGFLKYLSEDFILNPSEYIWHYLILQRIINSVEKDFYKEKYKEKSNLNLTFFNLNTYLLFHHKLKSGISRNYDKKEYSNIVNNFINNLSATLDNNGFKKIPPDFFTFQEVWPMNQAIFNKNNEPIWAKSSQNLTLKLVLQGLNKKYPNAGFQAIHETSGVITSNVYNSYDYPLLNVLQPPNRDLFKESIKRFGLLNSNNDDVSLLKSHEDKDFLFNSGPSGLVIIYSKNSLEKKNIQYETSYLRSYSTDTIDYHFMLPLTRGILEGIFSHGKNHQKKYFSVYTSHFTTDDFFISERIKQTAQLIQFINFCKNINNEQAILNKISSQITINHNEMNKYFTIKNKICNDTSKEIFSIMAFDGNFDLFGDVLLKDGNKFNNSKVPMQLFASQNNLTYLNALSDISESNDITTIKYQSDKKKKTFFDKKDPFSDFLLTMHEYTTFRAQIQRLFIFATEKIKKIIDQGVLSFLGPLFKDLFETLDNFIKSREEEKTFYPRGKILDHVFLKNVYSNEFDVYPKKFKVIDGEASDHEALSWELEIIFH